MFGDNDKDKVKVLTESEIMELQNKHGIVLFYMDGCGHCENMKPDWNKLIEELKDKHKDEIILGAIESSNMHIFKKSGISPSVSGFPTILYFHPNNLTRPDAYKGDRSYEDLKKWILDKKSSKGKPVVVLVENYKPDVSSMKQGMKGVDSMKSASRKKGSSQTGGGRRSRRNRNRNSMRKKSKRRQSRRYRRRR
jgi:thioredoxin-related protein